jgi:hypothetical protein
MLRCTGPDAPVWPGATDMVPIPPGVVVELYFDIIDLIDAIVRLLLIND